VVVDLTFFCVFIIFVGQNGRDCCCGCSLASGAAQRWPTLLSRHCSCSSRFLSRRTACFSEVFCVCPPTRNWLCVVWEGPNCDS
jgi:hypothetical protein